MKRKRFLTTAVGLVCVLALLVGGCSQPAPDQPIELIMSTYYIPKYKFFFDPFLNFEERVEERSNGRLEILFFHSSQLFGSKAEFAALKTGQIDITQPPIQKFSGIEPGFGIDAVPFLLTGDPRYDARLIEEVLAEQHYRPLYEKHGIELLATALMGLPNQVNSVDKEIRQPDDLNGLKVRALGASISKMLELVGATPVVISSSEQYTAYQTGVIDAALSPYVSIALRNFYEVTDYVFELNVAPSINPLVMNKAKFDWLPSDLQKIIQEAAGEFVEDYLSLVLEEKAKYKKIAQMKGMNIYSPTQEELRPWREKIEPVTDWWLEQYPEGQKVLDAVAAWKKANPLK